MQKKAVVLFSGGLDSTTCLAIAKEQGFACYALSFAYGQRHAVELEAARKSAKLQDVAEHKILSLPLDAIKGSSLTDVKQTVPDYSGETAIPNTYVPARNTIFLAVALGWAEVLDAHDIFIGANDVDYSGYPDCRPEYMQAFSELARLATKSGVEGQQPYQIHTPLLRMTKAEIIRTGTALGVNYAETISCYRADASGRSCGTCDSCTFRKKGFEEANLPDPTIYN